MIYKNLNDDEIYNNNFNELNQEKQYYNNNNNYII